MGPTTQLPSKCLHALTAALNELMASIEILTSVITLYYTLHPYVAETWYSPFIKCPGKKYLTTTLYPLIGASNAHCLFAMLKYIPNGG